ncbi:MAG TPA: hypothetical protein VK612_06510, partial [Pyrinomonadaceae bacterium]|nr:hypothetical protein [Pyrinomonadaceae bacterium]
MNHTLTSIRSKASHLTAAFILLLFVINISAADVSDYQKRIDYVRSEIEVLLGNIALSETGDEVEEPDAEAFAHLRELIPATETIDTPNGPVETYNQWLLDGAIAAEKETDMARRAQILTELNERLAAISVKLDDLQTVAAAERSKDEDKRKLAEILNRPEYQKPVEKAENPAGDWIKRLLEWIASWFPKFNPSGSGFSGFAGLGNIVFWVLIAGIILGLGFLVYKLAP